jgi:hypothetical protein
MLSGCQTMVGERLILHRRLYTLSSSCTNVTPESSNRVHGPYLLESPAWSRRVRAIRTSHACLGFLLPRHPKRGQPRSRVCERTIVKMHRRSTSTVACDAGRISSRLCVWVRKQWGWAGRLYMRSDGKRPVWKRQSKVSHGSVLGPEKIDRVGFVEQLFGTKWRRR